MTDSMVERVARAIFDRECQLTPSVMRYAEFEDSNTRLWYVALARAAIEAMFEPTDAMAEFAEENFDRDSDNIKTCWRAMISAALAQPTGEKPAQGTRA